jgi:amino acid transporter
MIEKTEGMFLLLFAVVIGLLMIFKKKKSLPNKSNTSPIRNMILLVPFVILLFILFGYLLVGCAFTGGYFCGQSFYLGDALEKINNFGGFHYFLPFFLIIITLLMYALIKFLKKISEKNNPEK